MTAADTRPPVWLLPVAILLGTLTDAIAGTALGPGRPDLMGDIHATPDEAAWLDVSYLGLKLAGFVVAAWMVRRWSASRVLLVSTLVMGGACGLTACLDRLDALVLLRGVQGFAGAALLISGQTILFVDYPRSQQPFLQAIFALGAVVAPTALAPALEGWLIDAQSWTWVFASIVPIAFAAAGLLLLSGGRSSALRQTTPNIDVWELALTCLAMLSLTYLFSQGSRWDWFGERRIVASALVGSAALALMAVRRGMGAPATLLNSAVFGSTPFAFASVVSIVAGAALLGSAYLIPALAAGLLRFTPTETGLLLLPSGGTFAFSLILTAAVLKRGTVSPLMTVPAGLLLFMGAMALLSGVTADSGAGDLAPALLMRGFALGLLFLSITLIALSGLTRDNVADGLALFNIGRQVGGLLGVAALQTLLDHEVVANRSVLGADITAAVPAVAERLAVTGGALTMEGIDRGRVPAVATRELVQSVANQATLIAFGTAFAAVGLLFVFAGPLILAFRAFLTRASERRAAHPTTGARGTSIFGS